MPELRVVDGLLRLSRDGAPETGLTMAALVHVMELTGSSFDVPLEQVEQSDSVVTVSGAAGGFEVSAVWRLSAGLTGYHDVDLTVHHAGHTPRDASLRISATVLEASSPRWLIPGLFYGNNSGPDNRSVYPRWDPAGGSGQDCVSDSWSFRADRTALPQVFCWSDTACVALWGDESSPLGQHGIGFRGSGGSAEIWLDVPAREEPVSYVGAGLVQPAVATYHTWQPGETRQLRFVAYVGSPDRHAYDPLLREAYRALRKGNALRPWMAPERAADLAAHGLLRWHYRPEHAALFETAAFDRAAIGERGDRPHMHVAWVSGAPWATALLEYGRRAAKEPATIAATAVLDKISGGLAPCGAFWGEWRVDGGWSAGWNEGGTLHARTLAEASLFMLRAYAAEGRRGAGHPGWASAVRSNLEFALGRQRSDGNFGSYYVPQGGEVAGWDGAAGLGWVAVLSEGSAELNEPGWLAAAEHGGDYYSRFVEDELIYGAPEDVHLTPSSEDGYQAVMAYMALYRATGAERWLKLARRAADWTLTFRYAYNVRFSPSTLLGAYDFRTRGADQASPANQHLHAYGLICLPEMVALWRATGDDYYLERTRDNLACFLQFVAREDGDFNAYRGMVSERYHQTDWGQPKGMLLTLSHAWSVGAVLHASLAAADAVDAFPPDWPPELHDRDR